MRLAVTGLLVCLVALGAWLLRRESASGAREAETISRESGRSPPPDPIALRRTSVRTDAPREPSEPPARPTPLEPPQERTGWTGRVVDESNGPVVAARVVLGEDGSPAATGVTGDDGTYRLPWRRLDEPGLVEVSHPTGLVAVAWVAAVATPPAEPVAVPTLVARRAGSVDLSVAAVPGGVEECRVEVRADDTDLPPYRRLVVRVPGSVKLTGLPAGSFLVLLSAPGCARVDRPIRMPADDGEHLDVLLQPERTLDVTVLDDSGVAYRGAQVTLWETRRSPFGEHASRIPYFGIPDRQAVGDDGRLRVRGLASVPLEVVALAPTSWGFVPVATGLVSGGDAALVLRGRPIRSVRVPIVGHEEAGLREGDEIGLRTNYRREFLPTRSVVRGSDLVVEGLSEGGDRFFATAPGGHVAVLEVPRAGLPAAPVRFLPPRRLDVALRMPDGTPAPGYRIQLVATGPLHAPVLTDAAGKARIAGLPALAPAVHFWRDGESRSVEGPVDLARGDASVEYVVRR